ncbi:ribonuclease HI [Trypanosoma cruzi]|nr:ribonuclease HI [Trypanosoma cruzi]
MPSSPRRLRSHLAAGPAISPSTDCCTSGRPCTATPHSTARRLSSWTAPRPSTRQNMTKSSCKCGECRFAITPRTGQQRSSIMEVLCLGPANPHPSQDLRRRSAARSSARSRHVHHRREVP